MLITGRTGSGKEVVARAFHACSDRSERNFVPVNCGSIPESLFETEMFGYAKGAFTGADQDRLGYIDAADGGTLFLDEINKMPLKAQGAMLRVLQDGQFYRVGGPGKIRCINTRVIAATNQDLPTLIYEGRFLEDLYSRLKVVKITLLPLEERLEDILPLAKHFISKHQVRPKKGSFSDFDIFSWVNDRYLPQTEPHHCRKHRYPDSISAALALTARTYPGSEQGLRPESGLDIRDLEEAVQRAKFNGMLRQYGDYPFEDLLTYQDQEILGPTCYTQDQLDKYDRQIVVKLCGKQNAIAKLLRKSESWVSREMNLKPKRSNG